jgi:predicted phosphodiesterase
VKTLVLSDFHLGSRLEHDVLRHAEPLTRLLEAIDGVDRVVLLGDIVELMEGRASSALRIAEPVLRAIGDRLGAAREVVLVPGNHDGPLVRPWVRRRGPALRTATDVPADATPVLASVCAMLAPARVRVSYPGVWLDERVWATHGHYLDRHLMPESAIGIARGILGRAPRDGALPIEYEHARRPSLTRTARWLPRPVAGLLNDIAELVRASTMPQRSMLHRGFAPVTSMVLGLQMRHASIPAMARVSHRLGIAADWVVFGHVHRLGPLAADDPAQWQGPEGSPRLLNTGSWLYEPLLIHRARAPHPYWPGGAVMLEPGREPRAVGLLDDLSVPELYAPRQGRMR